MKKLTPADRKAIVTALQTKHVTMKELAERYHVSIHAISYTFKTMGGKPLHRWLSQRDREAIVTELRSGKVTIADLAIKYGVKRGAISTTFKRITGQAFQPHKLSQTDRAAIVAALQTEKPLQELADKYGTGSSYLGSIYKRETGVLLRKLPQLSQSEKETIVFEIQAKKASIRQLASRYGVSRLRIRAVLQEANVFRESQYRAWHPGEKHMYKVYGIDWFNQKVLLPADGFVRWYPLDQCILLQKTGLRDTNRTVEHPQGREIYEGDIIQFSINSDGKQTSVTDAVAYDRELAGFIVSELDDPLAMYSNECEIIGNIYADPELLSVTQTMSVAS
jgi:uncharacterized phage protein (TIGR01671 family)